MEVVALLRQFKEVLTTNLNLNKLIEIVSVDSIVNTESMKNTLKAIETQKLYADLIAVSTLADITGVYTNILRYSEVVNTKRKPTLVVASEIPKFEELGMEESAVYILALMKIMIK